MILSWFFDKAKFVISLQSFYIGRYPTTQYHTLLSHIVRTVFEFAPPLHSLLLYLMEWEWSLSKWERSLALLELEYDTPEQLQQLLLSQIKLFSVALDINFLFRNMPQKMFSPWKFYFQYLFIWSVLSEDKTPPFTIRLFLFTILVPNWFS